MSFHDPSLGYASAISLVVYVAYTFFTLYVVLRKGFKNFYVYLLVYCLIRLGGQLSGVVYASAGHNNYQWLIAYLILGAEGYLAIVLAAFQTICRAQKLQVGRSWLLDSHTLFKGRSWASLFRLMFVPASVLVIVGGTTLADAVDQTGLQRADLISQSKTLRTAGQAIFLGLSVLTVNLNLYVLFVERCRNHFTLLVLCASPFLIMRGVFGVMSIYVSAMNYFSITGDIPAHAIVYEYVLSILMELIAVGCLLANYFRDNEIDGFPLADQTSHEPPSYTMGEKA